MAREEKAVNLKMNSHGGGRKCCGVKGLGNRSMNTIMSGAALWCEEATFGRFTGWQKGV